MCVCAISIGAHREIREGDENGCLFLSMGFFLLLLVYSNPPLKRFLSFILHFSEWIYFCLLCCDIYKWKLNDSQHLMVFSNPIPTLLLYLPPFGHFKRKFRCIWSDILKLNEFFFFVMENFVIISYAQLACAGVCIWVFENITCTFFCLPPKQTVWKQKQKTKYKYWE